MGNPEYNIALAQLNSLLPLPPRIFIIILKYQSIFNFQISLLCRLTQSLATRQRCPILEGLLVAQVIIILIFSCINGLFCFTDARGLPSVPPIRFTLPTDYPLHNPLCEMSMELYDTSEFFIDIKTQFTSSLNQLQNKYSMTALLDTWVS